MRRPKMYGTLIGNVYPFFLDNTSMKSYYLYQVVTPEMLSDYTPLLTFRKISERTKPAEFSANEKSMNHCDIIATLMHSRKGINKKAIEFLDKEILTRPDDKKKSNATFYENGYDFPLFEMDNFSNTTKALIIGLRDSLRWNQYRFQPGSYMDIMLTGTKFGLFEIKGDKDSIWLEPRGIYEYSDVELQNPLKIDLSTLAGYYPSGKFSGEKRASEMNRALRQTEWRSFDNAEIK